MRVLVTGGSGYVGSHAVRALIDSGHRPRLLVRDARKATAVLGSLGVEPGQVDFTPGDMLDRRAVDSALDGSDAAVHAAAAIGITGPAGGAAGRGAGGLVDTNVTGTRNVVGGAVERGLAPVVHVSTIAVFVPPGAPVITAAGALAAPRTDYGRSKVAAERYVRSLQDDGAPVAIVYPGGVCGPHQPSLDAMNEGLAAGLRQLWPLPPGGVSVVDVRDLGSALARAVCAGEKAAGGRWLLGGHYLTWQRLADVCDELTGTRCRRLRVPGRALLALGSALDLAKRVKGFDYPLTRDAAEMMTTLVPSDDRPTLDALEMRLRPVEETLADALRWLADAGHLEPRRIGRLARTPGRGQDTSQVRT